MKRFLAIVRRIFWGGTVSLLLCLFLCRVSFVSMIKMALSHGDIRWIFSVFFTLSPVLFLSFTIISTAYIRHYGQFAAIHREQSPIVSFFRCWWHDLISPFKNVGNFVKALFNKGVIGREIIIVRFIELVILIAVCVTGVLLLR